MAAEWAPSWNRELHLRLANRALSRRTILGSPFRPDFLRSGHTSPSVASVFPYVQAVAGDGRRRSSIRLKIFWNKLLGTATSANWNVTYRPWRTTLAPILTSFSRSVVSDQCSTLFGQGQRPHKIGQIVGQGVKLELYLVVAELAARQPRPFDSVLAFLDVLPRFASLIVESNYPLGGAGQVGDNEADTGASSPGCHSTLATTRRFLPQLPA